MKSIFTKQDNQEFINRINQLSPDTQSHWGKMNVAQMLVHCQVGLKVAYGEIKLKKSIAGFLFGRIAKKVLAKPDAFARNLPTAKSFIINDKRDFEKEKEILIAYISKAAIQGPSIIADGIHPFFGKMTLEEWDILQWKHLDHHLTQFGV